MGFAPVRIGDIEGKETSMQYGQPDQFQPNPRLRPGRAQEDNETVTISKRSGILGWWVDLTAPPQSNRFSSVAMRERLRKAELTSYSILAVFAFLIALISNSLASPSTATAVVVMAIGLIIAAVLNRVGLTRTAAFFVPGLLMLLIAVSLLGAPGLQLLGFPIYDLFVIPIFLTSLTANRRAPWAFGLLAIGFIIADFLLQPHALINAPNAHNFDDVAYETQIYGIWGMINRHVALCFFAALFGWLGALSVDFAIARADRAEEIAELQRAIAVQKRQLDIGIQQLLDTHVRAANGDYSARAPLSQDNLLFSVGASLNNLLLRLQRSGQAEFRLRRTEAELARVAVALDTARSGRQPIWPAPTGTAVDEILRRLNPNSPAAPAQPANSGFIGQDRGDGPSATPFGPSPNTRSPSPAYNPWSSPRSLANERRDLPRDTDALGWWGSDSPYPPTDGQGQ